MRYTYVEGHLQKMTGSPCLDMATLSIGAYLWDKPWQAVVKVCKTIGGVLKVQYICELPHCGSLVRLYPNPNEVTFHSTDSVGGRVWFPFSLE
jgi:hypothetical protein